MNSTIKLIFGLLLLAPIGCTTYFRDRMLFIEESHIGLVARASPDKTSPADVDFGYRRSFITLTPQVNVDLTKSAEEQRLGDNGEIMSAISAFTAKVRWLDATEIHTYFATGKAATNTASDVDAIKALTKVSKDAPPTKEGGK